MLRELFQEILSDYENASSKYQTTNQIPRLYEVLASTKGRLPKGLKREANLPSNIYKAQGSVGRGNITDTPWLGIFDKEITTSAQKGYYIVYLFRKDMSGVYLSLNQGWTQYKNKYKSNSKALKKISKNSKRARNLLASTRHFDYRDIDLSGNRMKAKGYEHGNICSIYYSAENIPDDDKIVTDLLSLIDIYRDLKTKIGNDILDIEQIFNDFDEETFQENAQKRASLKLPDGPRDKQEKVKTSSGYSYPRDPEISAEALEKANHTCELDQNHKTFIKESTGYQYVEAHHLIPISKQDNFKKSIDVPENIIALCPTCHRAVHKGRKKKVHPIIERFYHERKKGLASREIKISLEKLKQLY